MSSGCILVGRTLLLISWKTARLPLAVVASVGLAFHFWCNTAAINVIDRIMSPSIDVVALFEGLDEVMRSSKIASALEFTVVAMVRLLPFFNDGNTGS